MKKIIVTVAPDGQTQITAEGFEGSECRNATKFLGDALGQLVSEQLTTEYFRAPACSTVHEENRS